MKIFWNKIKLKRHFSFRKSEFNFEGDSFFNTTYETITDTYIITKAKEIADKYSCRIESILSHSWKINGINIVLYSTKENYINFCTEFCKAMGSYINDIEIC